MKKFLIAAAAVATLAGAAGAASAQPYGGPRYDGPRDHPRYEEPRYAGGGYGSDTINHKQDLLRQRIARGEQVGRITRGEGRQLRAELQNISAQERQFRASRGLDRREFSILNNRIERLVNRVNRELNDGQAYSAGYGDRGDRYDRYDRR